MSINRSLNPDSFEYRIPGKWILAGEHVVLRGSEALVFPLLSKYLHFKYRATSEALKVSVKGVYKNDLEIFLWSVIEKYLNELKLKRDQLRGELEIYSEIQFGAGMGASATLAVGLSLFFHKLGFLDSDLFEFSKKIEDLFHGESSGVDVAVALYQKPLIFKRGAENQFLPQAHLPRLCISYSGLRGITKDCVNKVKALIAEDSIRYQGIDDRMKQAVQELKKNLQSKTVIDDQTWARSIDAAQTCFIEWGLVPVEVQMHIDQLIQAGALSCKMTGSGGGGYVLSLWPADFNFKKIDSSLVDRLIPVESNIK